MLKSMMIALSWSGVVLLPPLLWNQNNVTRSLDPRLTMYDGTIGHFRLRPGSKYFQKKKEKIRKA